MISKIKRLFAKPEGLERASIPVGRIATFGLVYGNLPIGVLELRKGVWCFAYSEPFKRQTEIPPIVGFPDINKKYQSEDLWPFFISRIPSTSRPAVKEVLDKEHIDETDLAALLGRFGKKTISNPFENRTCIIDSHSKL